MITCEMIHASIIKHLFMRKTSTTEREDEKKERETVVTLMKRITTQYFVLNCI